MPTHPHSSRPSSSAGHANGLLIHHTTPNSPLYEDELPASSKAPLKYALKDIHPDDSKDKVFAAILKALLYLRNKPSSPKELANCIMKNKYTMLGYVAHTPSLPFFLCVSIHLFVLSILCPSYSTGVPDSFSSPFWREDEASRNGKGQASLSSFQSRERTFCQNLLFRAGFSMEGWFGNHGTQVQLPEDNAQSKRFAQGHFNWALCFSVLRYGPSGM